jgi:Skp family chaperone for outer membrane proteins
MEADVKEMKEAVDVLRTDSRDETLSPGIREDKRNELEEKLVELQTNEKEMIDFEKLRMQQLEQQNTRMSRKLFDEIHEAINNFSKEKGYKGVIDRAAQSRAGMQVVLYANPKADITADLLAILNEGREEILIKEPTLNVE